MASLAHATIVDEARLAPASCNRAPLIATAEDITPLIDGGLQLKRSNARHQGDNLPMMDRHFGALFVLGAKLTREVSNAA
jgi:hypothetical protein